MKSTMNEIQNLIQNLRPFYADVRLLDRAMLDKVTEGLRSNPHGEHLCYACRNKDCLCRHCAAKKALRTEKDCGKLEFFGSDFVQIIAKYYEIDGEPYILELVQKMPGDTTIDPEDEEKFISGISGYNAKLYYDALTNVFNRRYYEDVVRSMPGPAGIALIDIDDFKVYNDTYGHHAGDLALETVVTVVRSCIRKTDILVRFGGDELLLVLPNCQPDHLRNKLDDIRGKVYHSSVPGYSHLRLSVSIGGVIQTAKDTMETAVGYADRLMYLAKDQKNSIAVQNSLHAPVNTVSPIETPARKKPQILIVDDSEMNRMILSAILENDFRILEAEDGEKCLSLLNQFKGDIALVLLDLVMPIMDGFEVLNYMNRNHWIEDVPVIMISSEDSDVMVRKAYEMGASDYISRPFDSKVVYQRVFNTIKLYAKQRRLISMVSEQIHQRERNTTMLVGVLSQIVEFRNGESGLHVQHIRILSEKILERLLTKTNHYHLTTNDQELIPLASTLHDIGKIAIDEKILNKPGKLTKEEFEIIKTHTTHGADMLMRLDNYYHDPLLQTAYQIARWHHERWDGRGYPDGLVGDDIPIAAQIVSLADVYDALTSERCYKPPYSHEKTLEMIFHGECGAFNPLLLECLSDIQSTLQEELRKGMNDF